jgi:hypothetical protein
MTDASSVEEEAMMERHHLGLRMLIWCWMTWSMTTSPAAARAGSLSLDAISGATRTFYPFPPPGTAMLSPGLPGLFQASLDGRTPSLIDSALEFNIGSRGCPGRS